MSASGSATATAATLVLEYPLVKVASERLNLSVRHTQKAAEKEAERCAAQIKAVAKLSASGNVQRAEAVKALDILTKRLRLLKRTLERGRADEEKLLATLTARAAHVAEGEAVATFSSGAAAPAPTPAAKASDAEAEGSAGTGAGAGAEAGAGAGAGAVIEGGGGGDMAIAATASDAPMALSCTTASSSTSLSPVSSSPSVTKVPLPLSPATRAARRCEWEARRLDALIVDHLLREGYHRAAATLAKEAGVAALADIDLFEKCHEVSRALAAGDMAPAVAWCADNRSRLRKLGSDLEFSLTLQAFVEHLRAGDTAAALEHARTALAPHAETHMAEIRRAMGALAFGADTECPVYAVLFSEERWDALARRFQRDHNAMYSLTSVPVLSIALAAGITALKLPACMSAPADPAQSRARGPARPGQLDCPVCVPEVNALARTLPSSLHSQSKLVCGVTGGVMDVDNPPHVLPNGHVVSAAALTEGKRNGRFTCPFTQMSYRVAEIKKAFIM